MSYRVAVAGSRRAAEGSRGAVEAPKGLQHTEGSRAVEDCREVVEGYIKVVIMAL